MKYLIDEALIVESLVQDEVNEATGKKEKNYYIEGIFSTPDQKNKNGRIYSLSLWEREVAKYQEEIKNNTVNTLGEFEHPARISVDPLQAVMKVIELRIDEGLVRGKAKILNNNSEKTNQIKALIDEGLKIGVSSRGTGSVKGEYVENFNLTCYDLVGQPSDYNANLTGLCESLESSVILDKSENSEITAVCEIIEQKEIIESKKELSDFEKKIAQEKFMEKFSGFLDSVKNKKIQTLDESFKIKDKNAALVTLNMIKKNVDERTKKLVDGVIEFLNQ